MVQYVEADAVPVDAVESLLEACRSPDGHDALSEHKATRVGGAGDVVEIVSVAADGTVTGYAQAARHPSAEPEKPGHWAIEVAIRPGPGRSPAVPELVGAVIARLPDGDRVAVWAARDYVAAGLSRAGFRVVRRLLRLARALPFEAPARPPAGVRFDTFRPGRDEDAWLALNNAAFAGHPENGALDRDDLEERMSRPWFERAGFLLARQGSRLVGSCWTKRHDDRVGEIYIIAVHPDARGRGIGRALLAAGMEHLAGRGAKQVLLYTEADNAAGLALYRGAGFETEADTPAFAPPVG